MLKQRRSDHCRIEPSKENRDSHESCLDQWHEMANRYIIHKYVYKHILLNHIISYHIISYHIILYCIVLYNIMLYHIMFCYVILYHIISYHIELYYIILYHIILYYIIYTIYYNIYIYILRRIRLRLKSPSGHSFHWAIRGPCGSDKWPRPGSMPRVDNWMLKHVYIYIYVYLPPRDWLLLFFFQLASQVETDLAAHLAGGLRRPPRRVVLYLWGSAI